MRTTSRSMNAKRGLGRGAGRRRGTALIVVIGALALVAVFAALYVTIGQGDQRTAVAATITRQTEDVDRAFAERIVGIVGEDRLATYPVPFIDTTLPLSTAAPAGGPNTQRFVREATDYPYTDFSMRSQIPVPAGVNTDAVTRFLPSFASGDSDTRRIFGFEAVGDAGTPLLSPFPNEDPRADPRVASDPWLAATEPSTVIWRNMPDLATSGSTTLDNDGRSYSLLRHNNVADRHSHPALRYMDNRDWAQISNIAPDGRFVNLFNLRDNFLAEPGIGQGPDGHRMTSRLTLLEPTAFSRFEGLRATTALPFGLGEMASNTGIVDDEYLNIPAIWTMNQRFMFFPMNQPESFGIGRIDAPDVNKAPQNVSGWGDFTFPDYQYADADGDGMADARWFELVDASDPENIRYGLPQGDVRYFAAARIIDLSSMVNVNTATDGLAVPTNWSPLGMTPSDVDLRRLLMMTDQARSYRGYTDRINNSTGPDLIDAANAWRPWTLTGNSVFVDAFADGLSYRHIEQPSGYTDAEGLETIVSNYFGYSSRVSENRGAASLADLRVSELAGAFAYDAIRRAVEEDRDTRLEGGPDGAWFGQSAANVSDEFLKLLSPFEYAPTPYVRLSRLRYPDLTGGFVNNPYNGVDFRTRQLLARDHYYDVVGRLDASDATLTQPNPGVESRFGSRLFGVDDLSELLTYRAINDDGAFSRLERVVAGRFQNINVIADPTDARSTLRFSPLRSNRSTNLERLTHDNVTQYEQDYPLGSNSLEADNAIDAETMAMFALSPRSRLTTVSGASPIRESIVYERGGTTASPTYTRWDGETSDPPALNPLGIKYEELDFPGGPTFAERNDFVRWRNTRDALLTDGRVDFRTLLDAAIEDYDANEDLASDPGTGSPRRRRAVDTLFRLYADALLPDSGIDDGLAWFDPTAATVGRDARAYWSLAYGHRGPEMALLSAGHLTVNMLDLADEDSVPTAATVLMDGRLDTVSESGASWAYGTQVSSPLTYADANYGFQWGRASMRTGGGTPVPDRTEDGFIFDLDATEANQVEDKTAPFNRTDTALHPNLDGSVANHAARRAMTVFGIEAHPIITEVASVIVYSDTDEGVEPGFTSSATGGDVAVQALAFQIHNPFDVSVTLGGENGDITGPDSRALERWDYYVEYNGLYFPLVEYEFLLTGPGSGEHRFSNEDIVLRPGETRVFYAFNYESYDALESSWTTLSGLDDQTDVPPLAPGDSKKFFDEQFRGPAYAFSTTPDVDRLPILIHPVDPVNGASVFAAANGPFDLTEPLAPGSAPVGPSPIRDAVNDEVRLWRSYWNPDSQEAEEVLASNSTPDTGIWLENDILVDRLRDPESNTTEDTWDVKFDGLTEIRFDVSSDWPLFEGGRPGFAGSGPSVPNPATLVDAFATTYTVARWASVRRPDHEVRNSAGSLVIDEDLRGGVPAYMLESVATDSSMNIITSILPDNDELELIDDFRNGDRDANYITDSMTEQDRISDAYVAVTFDAFLESVGFFEGRPETGPTNLFGPAIDDRPLVPTLSRHPYDKGDYTLNHQESMTGPGGGVPGELGLSMDFSRLEYTDGAEPMRQDSLVGANGTPDVVSPLTRADGDVLAERKLLSDPELQPEIYLGNDAFRRGPDGAALQVSTLRVTDILRPLAIGPAHFAGVDMVDLAKGLTDPDVADGEWLTLGEALSIALGFEERSFYEDARDANGVPDPTDFTPLADMVQLDTSAPVVTPPLPPVRVFDRAQLRLTDFAPFVNVNRTIGSGVDEALAVPLFQPEVGDYRIGPARTPAMRLLSSLRGVTPLTDPTDPDRNNELARAVSGKVNINTAPVAVMRTLPGLSPSLEVDPLGRPEYDESWAGRVAIEGDTAFLETPNDTSIVVGAAEITIADRRDLGIPDPNDAVPSTLSGANADVYSFANPGFAPELWRQRPDVAPSILAYRDRTLADFRFDSREAFAGDDRIDDMSFAPLLFQTGATQTPAEREARFGLLARNFGSGFGYGPVPTAWNIDVAADRGRYMLNGIEAGRELPGFGSVSDLLGVTMATDEPLARFGLANVGEAEDNNGPIVGSDQQAGVSFVNYGLLGFSELSINGVPRSRWSGDVGVGGRFTSNPVDQTVDDDAPTLFGVHDMFAYARDRRAPVTGTTSEPINMGTRVIDGPNRQHAQTLDPYTYPDRFEAASTNPTTAMNPVRNLNDDLPNDYDEQLALLAGLFNTTDVRSDYFAAWLLVRGYSRGDVENLGESEPMLPSYQKRFLLILDRSNVTETGDQPRVLLYRELPL